MLRPFFVSQCLPTMFNKIRLIALLFVAAASAIYAQDAPAHKWTKEMSAGVSLTQSGYTNWSAGGVNSFSATGNLNGKFAHLQDKLSRTHTFNLAYGQLRQQGFDFRKSTDIVAYQFKLNHETGKKFKPTAVVDFATQFAPTYDYTQYDKGLAMEPKLKSNLFAPADLIEMVGYSYDPSPEFSQTLGIGAKQRFVNDETLRTVWGLKADESIRTEAGVSLLTKVNKPLMENVVWKSQLNIFMSFKQPANPNAEWAPLTRWDNVISMKVNKLMNVTFDFSMLYDSNVLNKVQVREVLAVGLGYKFF